jgi:hypothetical protein
MRPVVAVGVGVVAVEDARLHHGVEDLRSEELVGPWGCLLACWSRSRVGPIATGCHPLRPLGSIHAPCREA